MVTLVRFKIDGADHFCFDSYTYLHTDSFYPRLRIFYLILLLKKLIFSFHAADEYNICVGCIECGVLITANKPVLGKIYYVNKYNIHYDDVFFTYCWYFLFFTLSHSSPLTPTLTTLVFILYEPRRQSPIHPLTAIYYYSILYFYWNQKRRI